MEDFRSCSRSRSIPSLMDVRYQTTTEAEGPTYRKASSSRSVWFLSISANFCHLNSSHSLAV